LIISIAFGHNGNCSCSSIVMLSAISRGMFGDHSLYL